MLPLTIRHIPDPLPLSGLTSGVLTVLGTAIFSMRKIQLFAALTKVDEARREVWGLATAEVVDKDGEIVLVELVEHVTAIVSCNHNKCSIESNREQAEGTSYTREYCPAEWYSSIVYDR